MLVARGLSRRIGDRTLFCDLDLDLARGEVVCLSGPSGVGKSQLLRILAWLSPPSAGTVCLDGQPPSSGGVPRWRTRVAYVPQGVPRLTGTPSTWLARLDALAQAPGDRDDPRALGARMGLGAQAWDQPWDSLSGGEAQRIHLAIAMGRRPDVLLLDEPTSALDPATAAGVEALVLAGDWGVLWVTHDPDQPDRLGARRRVLLPPEGVP